jgi:ribosomal protein S18 acetylase RimI-like enzyme
VADRLSVGPALVDLRPVTPDDRDFLLSVYRSTREDELALTGWNEPQKVAFVTMQFEAQDSYYRQIHPDGSFLVVVVDGEPAGRLLLARLEREIRVIDIALLPAYRGAGIGTRLLRDVIADADAAALPVSLHVEPWSPARRLYERLDFRSVGQHGIYERMERPVPVS